MPSPVEHEHWSPSSHTSTFGRGTPIRSAEPGVGHEVPVLAVDRHEPLRLGDRRGTSSISSAWA